MRRLVRKSSEAGSAAAILISGLGSGASLGFRHLHDGIGKDGGSESSEDMRLPWPLSGEFFLDRKRFILTAALVVYDDLLPITNDMGRLSGGYRLSRAD